MARIVGASVRRAGWIGLVAALVATVPAGAGDESDASKARSSSAPPKVEHQTVGSGARSLTPAEDQKRLATTTQAVQMAQAVRPGPAVAQLSKSSQVIPVPAWLPHFTTTKEPGLTTFVPMLGFAERARDSRKPLQRPATAPEQKAGPAR